MPADPAGGETDDKEFVWIWYDTIPGDSPSLVEVLTDIDGNKHASTVPRGKVQPQVWQSVLNRQDTISNSHFLELLQHTNEPFVSAIHDFPGTCSVFEDGRVLLVGDAFALCMPHAGGSTSQAAFQVSMLRKVFEDAINLDSWQRVCIGSATKELEKSLGAAKLFFRGNMPDFVQEMVVRTKQ